MADRVALVTGAGGGIGTAICGKLQTEGVQVVATDVDEAALANLAKNCRLLGTQRLDVTQPGDWQA
ncbi:MAG: SDR family NAD(P)-dependent oxidoreductase, partial [Gammaproteobacteria bacterium]|nr:SDR family NAD(P)-dependent oxidoreductase [Gammaproteobacteria bacterium]